LSSISDKIIDCISISLLLVFNDEKSKYSVILIDDRFDEYEELKLFVVVSSKLIK